MSSVLPRACCGLLVQRPRWGLSLRGWLLALIAGTTMAIGLVRFAHTFLAISTPAPAAEILAVEGWIHEYALRAASEEFKARGYQHVVATGGPVQGVGGYRNDYSTAASIGAQGLKRTGLPADRVHMAPSRVSARDRTYSSAVALRDWLHARRLSIRALNVVTEDVHARRTRLLFQLAFGPDVHVGVISVPNPDYDATRWWRYSEGVRDVLGETISYLYAKFLFFPTPTPPST